MNDNSPPRVDQRRYLRVPVQVELITNDECYGRDYAINLSVTGMCLQSAEPYEKGHQLEVRFRLAPQEPWIETEAEVVWCTGGGKLSAGMTYCEVGLRFLKLTEGEEASLNAFVDRTSRYCDVTEPDMGKLVGWSG